MILYIDKSGLVGWVIEPEITRYHVLFVDSIFKTYVRECDFYGIWMILK